MEADVPLSTNGVIVGDIAHTPGSPSVVINSSGFYEITFMVEADRVNQFALFLDGTFIPGTIFSVGDSGIQNTGNVIVAITAPATLTMRNHTSFSAVEILDNNIGGTQTNVVNAMIRIVKLA